jgi:hypothetical protein
MTSNMSGHEDETLTDTERESLEDAIYEHGALAACAVVESIMARVAATARADAAEQIAAWSTPSGWVAQQAVVAYLEDGTDPQPWELDVTAKPDAVARVEAWCEEQDRLSKGESPTTRSVRAALAGDETRCAKHPHGYVLAGRCMVCAATEGEEDR